MNPFSPALFDSGTESLETLSVTFHHGFGPGRDWTATFEEATIHVMAERAEMLGIMRRRFWPEEGKPSIPMVPHGKTGRVRPMVVTEHLLDVATLLAFATVSAMAPEGLPGMDTEQSRQKGSITPDEWLALLQNDCLYDEALPVVDWIHECYGRRVEGRPNFLARLGPLMGLEPGQGDGPQSEPDISTPELSVTSTDC